mgnify:CR=1 FL=1
MKPTIDDKEVPARVYYYLLDWNERNNWKAIQEFGLVRLCDCTKEQIVSLFDTASKSDFKEMNN